jgi:DNA polymerase-3 subunit alpha
MDRLFDRVTELKMPAVAMTDYGKILEIRDFMKYAKNANIRLIIGCKFYPFYHEDIAERNKHPLERTIPWAKNRNGDRNLCKLVSIAPPDLERREDFGRHRPE